MQNLVALAILLVLILMVVKELLMPLLFSGAIVLGVYLVIQIYKLLTDPPRSPALVGMEVADQRPIPRPESMAPSRPKQIHTRRKQLSAKVIRPKGARARPAEGPPDLIRLPGAFRPVPALVRILSMAYRCRHFSGACRGMRWDPKAGHIPRGYCGATGTVSEVKLVLVVAEPGDPQPGDHETMDEALQRTVWAFREGPGLFHRNARKLLGYCWPDLGFDQQLRRVWITESVLCSAEVTTGPVPREVERACGEDYLLPQLMLFPRAIVVALGGKAHQRLKRLGIPHEEAHALAPPGCNQKAADPSWRRIGELVRRRG